MKRNNTKLLSVDKKRETSANVKSERTVLGFIDNKKVCVIANGIFYTNDHDDYIQFWRIDEYHLRRELIWYYVPRLFEKLGMKKDKWSLYLGTNV